MSFALNVTYQMPKKLRGSVLQITQPICISSLANQFDMKKEVSKKILGQRNGEMVLVPVVV